MILRTLDHAYHCNIIGDQEAVTDTTPSGVGYLPDSAKLMLSHFAILLMSESLVESLADADCDEKLKKAIVASMARITITTINSTKVKAEWKFRIQNGEFRIEDFLFDVYSEL
jgi:hypothetical protein